MSTSDPVGVVADALRKGEFFEDGWECHLAARRVLEALDAAGFTLTKRTVPGPPPPCLACGKQSDEGGWCHACWYGTKESS